MAKPRTDVIDVLVADRFHVTEQLTGALPGTVVPGAEAKVTVVGVQVADNDSCPINCKVMVWVGAINGA